MVGRPQFMRGLSKLFTALVIGAFLALPAGAIAQSSTGGYNQPGGVVQDQIQTQPAQTEQKTQNTPQSVTQTAPASKSSNLPFTGLDLAMVVAAGGVLLLLGFGIRRFTRASEVA
jgi:hypothetical protein